MRKFLVEKILQDVRSSYASIAEDFSRTRQENWTVLRSILEPSLQSGQRVLDAGCGNGRLVRLLAEGDWDIFYTGFDSSRELLSLARSNFGGHYKRVSCQWQEGELTHLPFPAENFDHVFVLASLHHLPSHQLRQRACAELIRVLKAGGFLLFINWNLWTRAAFRKYHLWPQIFMNLLRGYDWGDFFIPWRDGSGQERVKRYYHGFTDREIRKMFAVYPVSFIRHESMKLASSDVSQSFVTVLRKDSIE